MGEPCIIVHAVEGEDATVPRDLGRQLSIFERIWGIGSFRKALILLVLAAAWEIYARNLNNPLLFPTLLETLRSVYENLADGTLLIRAWTSIKVLLIGYAAGLTAAGLLTMFAIGTRIGTDLLDTATAMFSPLPALALLPLALLWFGLGSASLVFVLIHSVLWAVALNTHSGFLAVSQTLRMVGRNYGLKGPAYVFRLLVPAAFPSILTGLKIGWAFAWRTLIGAELVFGVSSGQGGLGWFIYENRNILDIPAVFAGLLSVIMIGLVVENLVFRTIEQHTIRRWGVSF
jgi:NitT/TauT family transport system permease protein